MHGVGIVNGLHASADRLYDTQRLVDRQRRVLPHPGIQVHPADELHDEVRQPVGVAKGIDTHHVLMANARHGPRLDQQAVACLGRQLCVDELDRHGPL